MNQSLATEKERLAVLNLTNSAQLSDAEVDFLTNLIRQAIAKRGQHQFIVMTQENILLLLPPDKKIEDCVSECEVDTGRLLGAKYIITGTVLKFGESLRVNLKFHETQNAALINSYTVKGNKVEDLEAGIENAAQELFNELLQSKKSATETKAETETNKAETNKAETNKAETNKAETNKAETNKAETNKAETNKAETKANASVRQFIFELGAGLQNCRKDVGDTCSSAQTFEGQPSGMKMNFHYYFSKNLAAGFEFIRNVANLKIPENTPSDVTVTWSNTQQLYLASLRYTLPLEKFDLSFGFGFGRSDFLKNLKYDQNAYQYDLATVSIQSIGFVGKLSAQAAYKFNQRWSTGVYFDYVMGGNHNISEYCTNYDRINQNFKSTTTCYSTSASVKSYYTKTSINVAALIQFGLYVGISF
jgi:hypothetical protein